MRQKLLGAIDKVWAARGHERFGQLISNLTARVHGPEVFYVEDDQLLQVLSRELENIGADGELIHPF